MSATAERTPARRVRRASVGRLDALGGGLSMFDTLVGAEGDERPKTLCRLARAHTGARRAWLMSIDGGHLETLAGHPGDTPPGRLVERLTRESLAQGGPAGTDAVSSLLIGRIAGDSVPEWILVAQTPFAGDTSLERTRSALEVVASVAATARRTWERERRRELEAARASQRLIAHRLHEGAVQRLYGLALALELGEPDRQRVRHEVNAALADLKGALRPSTASAEPHIVLALEVAGLRAQGATFDVRRSGRPLPPAAVAAIDRTLAEAVRNARKHAAPLCVRARIHASAHEATLFVANDGVPAGGAIPALGLGLELASLEAAQLGGALQWGPRGEDAWRLCLRLPLQS